METTRRHSEKRQQMLDLLRHTGEHPTVEMLYQAMKPRYPELSLGTVYRNLAILVEQKQVAGVVHVGGQLRYDARLDPHAHFVCRRCHKVRDLELPAGLDGLCAAAGCAADWVAESYALTVTGLCESCKDAINA